MLIEIIIHSVIILPCYSSFLSNFARNTFLSVLASKIASLPLTCLSFLIERLFWTKKIMNIEIPLNLATCQEPVTGTTHPEPVNDRTRLARDYRPRSTSLGSPLCSSRGERALHIDRLTIRSSRECGEERERAALSPSPPVSLTRVDKRGLYSAWGSAREREREEESEEGRVARAPFLLYSFLVVLLHPFSRLHSSLYQQQWHNSPRVSLLSIC